MLAITSITAFLGYLWAFFLPSAYTLQFPGRMVLYLKYFPISPNIITLLYPEFNATASEKQKSMWYSISHTCFVFLQETAHNSSKYYHIFYYHQAWQSPCQAIEFRLRTNSPQNKTQACQIWSYQTLDKEKSHLLHAPESLQTWILSDRYYKTFRRLNILQPLA